MLQKSCRKINDRVSQRLQRAPVLHTEGLYGVVFWGVVVVLPGIPQLLLLSLAPLMTQQVEMLSIGWTVWVLFPF